MDHTLPVTRRILSPTDISQFLRLERCERFLRLRMYEREVVIISATESDPDYIQASAGFLLDPRRLTVALSRAKRKMILVASRSIFEYASVDDIAFRNAQIWKNLLRRACRTKLYGSTLESRSVVV